MRVNARTKTLTVKLVCWGAGCSGKTTTLRALHAAARPDRRGELLVLDTEEERTLFFDTFPLTLGQLGGLRLRAQLFTVPGQSFYHGTRRALLQGADGVIFVADAGARRELANQQALDDLHRELAHRGRPDLPRVFAWNKRDLPDALPERHLERSLNPGGAPSVATCALTGEGVQVALALLLREVMAGLRSTETLAAAK